MAKSINKIRELLKEGEELSLKGVKKDDLEKLEKELESELKSEDKDEDEEIVEDDDLEKLEKELESELKSEDKDEDEVDDMGDVKPVVDVEVEVDDEDELEKEFDINDTSDVFLDDEEEEKSLKDREEVSEDDMPDDAVYHVDGDEDGEKKREITDAKKCSEESDEEEDDKNDIEEHMTALFNGEDLTDEFKNKARTIFEAAVRERVIKFSKRLKERYNTRLRSAKGKIEENLVKRIDGYMDYVVEEWLDQNKVAVDHGLRTEITEEFITDLRSLFESHNIMIPKGKENLVESLANKVEKLEKELNGEIKKNVTVRKKLNEYKRNEAFREICEGLADTEIEKLKSLASSLEYDDSYRDRLNLIKENYFSQKTKKAGSVEEIADVKTPENEISEEFVDDNMASYLNVISKIR